MVPQLKTLFPCWKQIGWPRGDFGVIVRLGGVLIFLLPGILEASDEPDTDAPSAPTRIVIGQTLQPGDENQPAEVEGVVTFAGKRGRGARWRA